MTKKPKPKPKPEPNPNLEKWLKGRPKVIRDLAHSHPPGWYELTTDSEPHIARYLTRGYNEDGTMSMVRYSVTTGKPQWGVFGLKPEDLKPSESPEEVRAKLSPDELFGYRVLDWMVQGRLEMMRQQIEEKKAAKKAATKPKRGAK